MLMVNNCDFHTGLVDIGQAFLQSSYLHDTERIIAPLPPYLRFGHHTHARNDWSRYIATTHKRTVFEDEMGQVFDPNRFPNKVQYGIKLYRPLYGSRDAPLRWFVTIAHHLRSKGFVQYKTDCCLFGLYRVVSEAERKLNPQWALNKDNKRLECLVMLHVGDMLFTGTQKSRGLFAQRVETMARIPTQFLSTSSPLIFCGVEIVLNQDRTIELSQNHLSRNFDAAN